MMIFFIIVIVFAVILGIYDGVVLEPARREMERFHKYGMIGEKAEIFKRMRENDANEHTEKYATEYHQLKELAPKIDGYQVTIYTDVLKIYEINRLYLPLDIRYNLINQIEIGKITNTYDALKFVAKQRKKMRAALLQNMKLSERIKLFMNRDNL